jgi:protein TonB
MKKLPLTLALLVCGAFSMTAAPAFDPAVPEAVSVGRLATLWGPMPEYQKVTPLKSIPPDYGLALKQKGITGTVTAAALVGSSGQVVDVTVVASSGNKKLDETALAALRQWRFPVLRDGRHPIRYTVKQSFVFTLAQ